MAKYLGQDTKFVSDSTNSIFGQIIEEIYVDALYVGTIGNDQGNDIIFEKNINLGTNSLMLANGAISGYQDEAITYQSDKHIFETNAENQIIGINDTHTAIGSGGSGLGLTGGTIDIDEISDNTNTYPIWINGNNSNVLFNLTLDMNENDIINIKDITARNIGQVAANVAYFSGDGVTDKEAIDAAIAHAASEGGGIVVFEPSVIYEIDGAITISDSDIHLQGNGCVVTNTTANEIINIAASDIIIEDFTLVGTSLGGTTAVITDYSTGSFSNITIRNCHIDADANSSSAIGFSSDSGTLTNVSIHDCHAIVRSSNAYGISFAKNTSGLSCKNNVVNMKSSSSYNGIAIYADTNGFVVSGNRCYGAAHSAIACSPAHNGIIDGNYIEWGHEASPPGNEAGLEAEWKDHNGTDTSHDIIFSNNTVIGYRYGFLAVSRNTDGANPGKPYNLTVTGNSIRDCGSAIGVSALRNVIISNNTISQDNVAGQTIVMVASCEDMSISGNTIINTMTATNSGILLTDTHMLVGSPNSRSIANVSISDNVLKGFDVDSAAIDIRSAGSLISVRDNHISDCAGNGIINDIGIACVISGNVFDSVSGDEVSGGVQEAVGADGTLHVNDNLDMNGNSILINGDSSVALINEKNNVLKITSIEYDSGYFTFDANSSVNENIILSFYYDPDLEGEPVRQGYFSAGGWGRSDFGMVNDNGSAIFIATTNGEDAVNDNAIEFTDSAINANGRGLSNIASISGASAAISVSNDLALGSNSITASYNSTISTRGIGSGDTGVIEIKGDRVYLESTNGDKHSAFRIAANTNQLFGGDNSTIEFFDNLQDSNRKGFFHSDGLRIDGGNTLSFDPASDTNDKRLIEFVNGESGSSDDYYIAHLRGNDNRLIIKGVRLEMKTYTGAGFAAYEGNAEIHGGNNSEINFQPSSGTKMATMSTNGLDMGGNVITNISELSGNSPSIAIESDLKMDYSSFVDKLAVGTSTAINGIYFVDENAVVYHYSPDGQTEEWTYTGTSTATGETSITRTSSGEVVFTDNDGADITVLNPADGSLNRKITGVAPVDIATDLSNEIYYISGTSVSRANGWTVDIGSTLTIIKYDRGYLYVSGDAGGIWKLSAVDGTEQWASNTGWAQTIYGIAIGDNRYIYTSQHDGSAARVYGIKKTDGTPDSNYHSASHTLTNITYHHPYVYYTGNDIHRLHVDDLANSHVIVYDGDSDAYLSMEASRDGYFYVVGETGMVTRFDSSMSIDWNIDLGTNVIHDIVLDDPAIITAVEHRDSFAGDSSARYGVLRSTESLGLEASGNAAIGLDGQKIIAHQDLDMNASNIDNLHNTSFSAGNIIMEPKEINGETNLLAFYESNRSGGREVRINGYNNLSGAESINIEFMNDAGNRGGIIGQDFKGSGLGILGNSGINLFTTDASGGEIQISDSTINVRGRNIANIGTISGNSAAISISNDLALDGNAITKISSLSGNSAPIALNSDLSLNGTAFIDNMKVISGSVNALYFVDENAVVYRYTPDGQTQEWSYAGTSSTASITAITRDSAGRIIFTDNDNADIVALTSAGVLDETISGVNPVDLTIDDNDNIYYISGTSVTVHGSWTKDLGSTLYKIVYHSGFIYVADGAGFIWKLALADGAIEWSISTDFTGDARSIVFDNNGYVYLLQYDSDSNTSRIYRFLNGTIDSNNFTENYGIHDMAYYNGYIYYIGADIYELNADNLGGTPNKVYDGDTIYKSIKTSEIGEFFAVGESGIVTHFDSSMNVTWSINPISSVIHDLTIDSGTISTTINHRDAFAGDSSTQYSVLGSSAPIGFEASGNAAIGLDGQKIIAHQDLDMSGHAISNCPDTETARLLVNNSGTQYGYMSDNGNLTLSKYISVQGGINIESGSLDMFVGFSGDDLQLSNSHWDLRAGGDRDVWFKSEYGGDFELRTPNNGDHHYAHYFTMSTQGGTHLMRWYDNQNATTSFVDLDMNSENDITGIRKLQLSSGEHTGSTAGELRYYGDDVQLYDGSAWTSLATSDAADTGNITFSADTIDNSANNDIIIDENLDLDGNMGISVKGIEFNEKGLWNRVDVAAQDANLGINWQSATYDDKHGRIVAAAPSTLNNYPIMYSADNGSTWTAVDMSTGVNSNNLALRWTNIIYVSGRLFITSVSTDSNYLIAYSDDGGSTWTGVDMSTGTGGNSLINKWNAITSTGGRIIIGGTQVNSAYTIAYSTDNGDTWTGVDMTSYNGDISALAYDGSSRVLAVSDVNNNRVLYSDNGGDSWTGVDMTLQNGNDLRNTWNSIAYINGRWVILANSGNVYLVAYSDDGGASWTGIDMSAQQGQDLSGIAWRDIEVVGDSVLMITGSSGVRNFAYSYDYGETWESTDMSAQSNGDMSMPWYSIVHANDRTILIGNDGTYMASYIDSNVSFANLRSNSRIINAPTPVLANDVANKDYVDSIYRKTFYYDEGENDHNAGNIGFSADTSQSGSGIVIISVSSDYKIIWISANIDTGDNHTSRWATTDRVSPNEFHIGKWADSGTTSNPVILTFGIKSNT